MSFERVRPNGYTCRSCGLVGEGDRADWVHLVTRFSALSGELQHSYWCPTCWEARNAFTRKDPES